MFDRVWKKLLLARTNSSQNSKKINTNLDKESRRLIYLILFFINPYESKQLRQSLGMSLFV